MQIYRSQIIYILMQIYRSLIKITGYLKNIDSVSCISKLMGEKGGIYYLNSRISDQGG
jgi:hypothetical protein